MLAFVLFVCPGPFDTLSSDAGSHAMNPSIPFDAEAARYDDAFTWSIIGQRARARFWGIADRLLQPGLRVLELGGGTGEDACHFAARGLRVCCTDASAEMLAIGQTKANARGLSTRIEFHVLDMNRLANYELETMLAPETYFDAAYSNFGALNCVNDVAGLGRMLATRLPPGAPLLLTVMGPHCPWEWLWYTAQGQPRKAFRRWQREGTAWRGLTIRYPSVTQLAEALSPSFRLRGTHVVNAFLPPSYTESVLGRVPALLRHLDACDAWLQDSRLVANASDHYLAHFERSENGLI